MTSEIIFGAGVLFGAICGCFIGYSFAMMRHGATLREMHQQHEEIVKHGRDAHEALQQGFAELEDLSETVAKRKAEYEARLAKMR